jgi:di- and tripeptidase
MAMIFAVNELVTQQNLNVNVSFIIEGEEENGSQGFQEMVLENANFFDKPDVILLSNSYWLGENTPCLTYGLRGFIKFSIQVTNPHASNLHSGVDGGPSEEPLLLLTKLVSKLTDDDGQLVVEGFSDSVQPITQAEDDLYTQLVEHIYPNDTQKRQELKETLQKKWRYPCFSLHNIQASGPTNSAIIPKTATANASVRIVPNQDLDKIAHDMETHLVTVFDSFQSKCTLNVTASKRADWWLGDPNGTYFKCLQDCIQNEWKMSPFLIREGGSIPAVRWLERTFDAIALNLPMGQSSDAAHLSNERIRLQNLYAGKRIVQTFLSTI